MRVSDISATHPCEVAVSFLFGYIVFLVVIDRRQHNMHASSSAHNHPLLFGPTTKSGGAIGHVTCEVEHLLKYNTKE